MISSATAAIARRAGLMGEDWRTGSRMAEGCARVREGVLYRCSTLCTFVWCRARWFIRRARLAVLIERAPIPHVAAAAARVARHRHGDPMALASIRRITLASVALWLATVSPPPAGAQGRARVDGTVVE